MATRTHVVGAGVQIRGALQGSGELTIRGSLEGELQFTGTVRVESGARLLIVEGARGTVDALQVAGSASGEVHGAHRIAIQAGGTFDGALVAPVVVIEDGARVRGWIETTGQAATHREPVTPAPAAPVVTPPSAPVVELLASQTEPGPVVSPVADVEHAATEDSATASGESEENAEPQDVAMPTDSDDDVDAKPAVDPSIVRPSNKGKRR
jgi:cytoskeletal protein CcmA (bactofilin family)